MPDSEQLKDTIRKISSERDELYNALLKTQKDFESLKHAYNKTHSEYIQKVNECQHWKNEFEAALLNGKKKCELIEQTYKGAFLNVLRDLEHHLKEHYPHVDRNEIEMLIVNLMPVSVHY